MKYFYFLLLGVCLLSSCEDKQTIEGLWTVQTVKVGDEEMTPNARWIRFNSDFTQESGNGWFQHSIGTWKLESNKLEMVNTNGLNDPYQPFEMTLDSDRMTWKRTEDGQPLEVFLTRSSQLPKTYGDQILGLWKLEEAVGRGNYFSEKVDSNEYIFFRWDKRYEIGSNGNRYRGIYQVHGHRPHVELIPYDEKLSRNNWEINYDQDGISLKKLNIDSTVTRKFRRIHNFPQ